MKTKVIAVSSFLFSTLANATDGDFTIADPAKGIFGAGSKISQTMYTAEWIIKGGAGLFAISCFVSAGNLARQGQYGRAGGSVIGGIIASIGGYLVHLSQT